jgi:hypothetical protein
MRAQAEQEERDRYSNEPFGNPNGPNGLAARSKSPHVVEIANFSGSLQLRAVGEFKNVQLTLQQLYDRLIKHQSERHRLWYKGGEALAMATEFESDQAGNDTSFATTFNAEVNSMLTLYSAEMSLLLKLIGETERHQMLISQDRRLDAVLGAERIRSAALAVVSRPSYRLPVRAHP